MRTLLIVDGNYFAQRVLGQLNIKEKTNNLETEQEQNEFVLNLYYSLMNLWKTFSNSKNSIVQQLVFCSDFGSWRKEVEPFIPYWIDKKSIEAGEIVVKYKENRASKKEESSINYDNFYKLYQQFVDDIKLLGVCTFKVKGLEGDDIISLLSKIINQKLRDYNVHGIVFATDGDLNQVVNDRVVLFKNSRSSKAPNGEVIINLDTYQTVFAEGTNIEKILQGGSNLFSENLKALSRIYIGDIEGNTIIKRSLGEGISIAQPFKTLFVKSVAGDKKDNLFSPISWKSKTGSVRYGITEKHIMKALDMMGLALVEKTCKMLLSEENADKLHEFVTYLCEVTKQSGKLPIDVTDIIDHIKHNLKMNDIVSETTVVQPKELHDNFQAILKDNLELVLKQTFPEQDILNKIDSLKPKSSVWEESIEDFI